MSTNIEWTDETWNPVSGCTRVSDGCTHCYIERTPPFRMSHRRFDGKGTGSTTGVQLYPDRLSIPLHWRKPRKVFVCSLADLFQDEVPDEFIAHVFAVMQSCAAHTFQVLTKRHARMRSLLNSDDFWAAVTDFGAIVMGQRPSRPQHWPDEGARNKYLPNVWLGCTAENQQWADIRIPALLDTPAAMRFVSAEPLLGPIDLTPWLVPTALRPPELHWVITGGESGPGARPAHPAWFRLIRDECQAAGVAFLHKQHGEWVPERMNLHADNSAAAFLSVDGRVRPLINGKPAEPPMSRGDDITIRRVGKHRAGRDLDGREWNEYPQAVIAR